MKVLAWVAALVLGSPWVDAQEAVEELAPPNARFVQWDQRDAEGRWAAVAQDLALDRDLIGYWISHLESAGDEQLLAWLALTLPYSSGGALDALVRRDATSWMAVTVWRLGSSSSHSITASRRHLEERPQLTRAWLELHAESLPTAVLESLRTALPQSTAALPVDAARRLDPPIDATGFLDVLRRTESAVPFGMRLVAADGELYLHQVERAVSMLIGTVPRSKETLAALSELARSRHDDLAALAGRSFASLFADEIPAESLFELAADPARSAAVREALFLGATYGPDTVVWVHLHAALLNPRDVVWDAALARAREVGDAFTLALMADLDDAELVQAQRERLDKARSAIRERIAADSSPTTPDQARRRAEYARSIGHRLAPDLMQWADR